MTDYSPLCADVEDDISPYRKKSTPLWRTVENQDWLKQYQCLNCKKMWFADVSPSTWMCCPNCLVVWKKEWTTRKPRTARERLETQFDYRHKTPVWIIERMKERYGVGMGRWYEIERVTNVFAEKHQIDLGDRVYRGVAGHLKFKIDCERINRPGSKIRVMYYDGVNPARKVKEYNI